MPSKEWGPLRPVVETPEGIGHTLPEGPVGFARDIPTGGLDPATAAAGNGCAVETDLRTIETINTPDNRLDLGKSDALSMFFIRFAPTPDEPRDDHHITFGPAIRLLEEAGYRFKPLPEGGMAWQKPYSNRVFSMKAEMDARGIIREAATLMGAPIGKGAIL